MEQEIKYTVAVSGDINDFDTEDVYRSPQYFYMRSNDELVKFIHLMVIDHKKNVMIYQGKP